MMAWYRQDDKSLSEPVMVSLLTHICITLPQWVNMNKILSWSLILTLIFWCYWLNIPILILELFETILNFSENFLSLRMPPGNPISSDLWKFHLPPPPNPCWSSQLHVLYNFLLVFPITCIVQFSQGMALILICSLENSIVFERMRIIIIVERMFLDKQELWDSSLRRISTHCGLVTPYGGRDLGQHWFR